MDTTNSIKRCSGEFASRVKEWLGRLSFRSGVWVLAMCVSFYILSFAQMALPISTAMKGTLWFIFFGLAKLTQYGGLTILGAKGISRLKQYFRRE